MVSKRTLGRVPLDPVSGSSGHTGGKGGKDPGVVCRWGTHPLAGLVDVVYLMKIRSRATRFAEKKRHGQREFPRAGGFFSGCESQRNFCKKGSGVTERG